jgi:hypothetical protein
VGPVVVIASLALVFNSITGSGLSGAPDLSDEVSSDCEDSDSLSELPDSAASLLRRITTLVAVLLDASFSGFFPERTYARNLSASMSEIALKWFFTWTPSSPSFAITVFVSSLSSLAISKTLRRLIQLRSQNIPD